MELSPTQELVDEFVGEQAEPSGTAHDGLRRTAPVSLDKQRFLARVCDLVNPEAATLLELESRRWAPWSLFGFSCDCLPWGSTKVAVSDVESFGGAQASPRRRIGALTSSHFSLEMDADSKNLVHSSAIVVYPIEALLLFALCATFFTATTPL